jgi:hypothetical protein
MSEFEFLTKEMMDGFIDFTHERLASGVPEGIPGWSMNPESRRDIIYVQYLVKTKNLFGKEKEEIRTARFSLPAHKILGSNNWGVSAEAEALFQTLNKLKKKAVVNQALDGLEKEYGKESDDFSSGVVFTIQKIREVLNGTT